MTRLLSAWPIALAGIVVIGLGADWIVNPGHPFGDDNSAHFAAAIHIAEVLKAGESNLWWHQSNLGIPLFAAYQPLPTLSMGTIIAVLGEIVAPISLFKASIILAWALMPFAWYRGARWYGLPHLFCLFLGLLTLTVHDPFSIGFGFRSATERGLYTQHFGLLFLPLFMGAFRQMMTSQNKRVLPVAALFALTAMSHLWVGLYAGIMALTWTLAKPKRWREYAITLTRFSLYCAAMLGWWIIPLLATNDYAGGLPWMQEMHNGWPWPKTLGMMVSGEVFDHSRLPVVTLLAAAGGIGLFRYWRVPSVRHWGLLTLATGFFFLGRTNLGDAYNWVPLHSQVNVMRYLTGVHICGIIAAATALFLFTNRIHKHIQKPVTMLITLFVVAYSGHDIQSTLKTFDAKQSAFAGLVDHIQEQPDHRIAVHGDIGTGNHFHRDLLPLLTQRGQLQSYALGFHATLSTYYAEYFDFSPAACSLFNVGSIVARGAIPPSFPADAYAERWQHKRYTVFHPKPSQSNGVFSLVQVQGAIEAPNFRAMRPALRVLAVPAFARGVLPRLVAKSSSSGIEVRGTDGTTNPWRKADARTLLGTIATGAPHEWNTTLSESARKLAAYSVQAEVAEGEHPWLLLKVNAFPWWQAYINDIEVPIQHVAPNFMAIELRPGSNQVRFEFKNPWLQKIGALLCLFLMILCAARAFKREP